MKTKLTRRQFIKNSVVAAAGVGLSRYAFAATAGEEAPQAATKLVAKADAMIHIWLPGGIAQTDTWDPKKYTPFRPGMKGNELLGTCESIPTSADGTFLGTSLETIGSMIERDTMPTSLTNETQIG